VADHSFAGGIVPFGERGLEVCLDHVAAIRNDPPGEVRHERGDRVPECQGYPREDADPQRRPGRRAGAGERTRTSDPRITNALLYQLSYPGLEGAHSKCAAGAREAWKRPNPPKRASGLFPAQLDDELDSVDLHPGRGLGQALEYDVVQFHVHEGPSVEVMEVVVRVGVRVEPAAIAAHRQLTDQTGSREQVQRVVDGCLGHAQAQAAKPGEHLFGGEVLWPAEEQRSNPHALRGGPHSGTRQSLVEALDQGWV